MRLVGLAAAAPRQVVKSESAHARFPAADVERIVSNIGVLEHRESPPGQTASDLCAAAAEPLLERLGWERKSIDALLLVTNSPDHIMPASAHRVHHALGLGDRCLAFDINLGCSGFTHGLIVMHSLMASGLVRRGLLLCGESTTGRFRPGVESCTNPADLGNALLFGDAGSAAALVADGADQLRARAFGADGSGMEHIIVPGGGFRMPWGPELYALRPAGEAGEQKRPVDLVLLGPQVFSFTIKRVPPLLEGLLADAAWTVEGVDVFVLHQANKFMLEFLRKRMKLPAEKVPLSIDQFGNTSSASIPLTMVVRASERLARPTRWVMMGFGVGLSWSGVALETDQVVALPLIEV